MFMSIKIFQNLNHFSHGMHHSIYQWSLFMYAYDSKIQQNSTNPDAGYPDWLGPSGRFVENNKKLTCLEITGYQMKYSTVLWLLVLQIRRGRKLQTLVHTVNSNSWTSNCQFSPFSKKSPIIRIFSLSGWLGVLANPDKWSSTVVRRDRGNTVVKVLCYKSEGHWFDSR